MAYSAETKTGEIEYEIVLQHNPTGIRANFTVNPYLEAGGTPTEAQRDALIQGFLNHLATAPNTSVVSAVKRGTFSSNITVG